MTLYSLARPDVRGTRHRGPAFVVAALACVGAALASPPASAVGLGAVTQQSSLGQSLRIVVPVTLGEGDDVASECFRIVAADRDADGVPQVLFGRVSVERSGAGTALVVTNARPVNDPVVRLTLQAGCQATVRREYTLLMDPPAIEAPVVTAEPAPSEVAAAPAPRPAPAARETRRPARPPTRPTTSTTTRQVPSAATGQGSEAARKPAPTKGRAAAKPAPVRPPPPSRPPSANQPRLAVSSGSPAAAAEADRERARQEKAAAIDAETQVLRQRIVELTALVERMQEELRAQERAEQAAAAAAKSAPAESASGAAKEPSAVAPQEPAKAPPPPATKAPPIADGDWWDDNGTLIGILILLPFLLAAFLLWRRRRAAEDERWRVARNPPARDGDKAQGPTSALRNPVAGLVSPRTEATSTITGQEPVDPTHADVTVDAVAVSELSHATEEAGVFLAFGQTERAIDVLREHIRQLPRSMPAAWLMLLDLYHAQGDRPEFRKLAEDFHVHFNVQTPLWEAFGVEDRPTGGIESFPHVQKQVVELWRKPGCRAYLERLLYDNREGRRNGFPLAAYSDILLLLQVLDAPEDVDIDMDLVESGKLEAAPKPAAPAAEASSRARRPMPPDPSTSRPAQQPIRFELDPPTSPGKPEA